MARPRRWLFGLSAHDAAGDLLPAAETAQMEDGAAVDVLDTDPFMAYLQTAPGPIALAKLGLASPALERLRDAGVSLVVPLKSQGELVGTLNLGPRLSEQDYGPDDRRLLASLASRAAPAIRVAQLIREHAAEAAERERYEQEMRFARLIQQQFLPRDLPTLPGWQVAAYYAPAHDVGGDFYDFIDLGTGRVGVVVGDVTDKGVPAALVMARTHSILRAEAPRLVAPAQVLRRANELLVPEMPPRMFVTCLFGVLEPATGRFVFANAGHNLPSVQSARGVAELRATGLPLGLMPNVSYDETVGTIGPGDAMLLYSDGLVEAHGPGREMYGFGRLHEAMAANEVGAALLDRLLDGLHAFTGAGWQQEDDITMVTLRRSPGAASRASAKEDRPGVPITRQAAAPPSQALLAFSIPGASGNERGATARVDRAVARLGLRPPRLERLRTAVAETLMNAIEYGSQGRLDVPVDVRLETDAHAIRVRITDRALSGPLPDVDEPDLAAKLEGREKPRGWGLFLTRHMVDGIDVSMADGLQTVTLTIARDED